MERPIRYQIDPTYTVNDPQFQRTMSSLLGPPLVGGNATVTLRNGDEIFPAMLAGIRGAKKTVTFETFIYWSGTIGKEFLDAFVDRARAGVKVLVLIDALGGDKIDPAYIKRMKDAGVEVYEYHAFHFYDPASYSSLDHRTHRKLLIVDGKVGFIGGVGIADVWRGHADRPDHWRDNHYRVEGPVVAQLQAAFADNWMQTTGVVLHGEEYFPPLAPAGPEMAQVFKSSFTGGSENMQLMVLLSIAAAGKTVKMESAYFVPDELTRRSMIAACLRGVKVEVVVPGPHIDKQYVRAASRAEWGELLKAGVGIYEYQPTMLHTKLLIVDDRWVSVGSSNLDNRSFRLNDEANLNVLDGPFAAAQVRFFEEDKRQSRRVTLREWERRPLFERIGDKLSTTLGWEL